jgi:ABC-type glycerol-3-phosphate transport system permease component
VSALSSRSRVSAFSLFAYPLLAVVALVTLVPFLTVVAGSLTDEREMIIHGVRLVPRVVSFEAFGFLLTTGAALANAYKITLVVTAGGTALSMALTAALAYSLAVRQARLRNVLAFVVYLTMIFSGGMIPWYILISRTLHLKDTLWALVLPMAVNPFFMFLMRNYFREIPASMRESAQMDGAGELVTWWRIYLPLSTPVVATLALFYALGYWNEWYLALFFIDENRLVPLQYHLYRILSNITFLQSASGEIGNVSANRVILPTTGVKFATTVVTIGPIILAYPFVQRYFVKGIMIGAIKG